MGRFFTEPGHISFLCDAPHGRRQGYTWPLGNSLNDGQALNAEHLHVGLTFCRRNHRFLGVTDSFLPSSMLSGISSDSTC